MIIVTGGAGFIGINFVMQWLASGNEPLLVIDNLSLPGQSEAVLPWHPDRQAIFFRRDIRDLAATSKIFEEFRPRAIVHFAAESSVDRSIRDPLASMSANVEGTCALLEAARKYWKTMDPASSNAFRFMHISTDEVYGTSEEQQEPAREGSAYAPNSPYAASKAAADHFVRAYHRTYGLPTLTTHACNNYGPFQSPDKLIPLTIANALARRELPIYGDGENMREWLFVADHCDAVRTILRDGFPGDVVNIGGGKAVRNIDLVHSICDILETLVPSKGTRYAARIEFVADRPGHDQGYSMNSQKAHTRYGWQASTRFEDGLRSTVQWYVEHPDWIAQFRRASV